MTPAPPVARELLLLGGGHAHLGVLRDLARRGPPPGVRVTLVAREAEAIYSGMLPGLIAGRFAAEDCVVDLPGLARAAGARFIRAEACGLDRGARLLACRGDRPPLRYDLLSIDIGSVPALVPGAAEHAIPLRPLDRFLSRWWALRARAEGAARRLRLLVVGAGAAGVEVALALRQGLGTAAEVAVLARGGEPLPSLAPGARRAAERALGRAGVALHGGAEASRVARDAVLCADGRAFGCDAAVWATGAAPVPWLQGTGLDLCPRGFLAVDAALRSTGDPAVFAAGDCATVLPHPRPRAGVFAVRQGPPLARNLRLALAGRPPRPFHPQQHWLVLLLSGPGRAIAARGRLAAEGGWALALKDWIDRRWIRMHREMSASMAPAAAEDGAEMRCGGCAAKLPAAALARVLARLPGGPAAEGAPDDAALLRPPSAPGRLLVQTVDMFRAVVDDPWLFGRIAANHALGDIAAMGAEPRAALAIAVLPPAAEAVLEADLLAMLRGGQAVLEAAGARLVGGHSAEGAEAMLGFAVTGEVEEGRALRRGGLRPGDALVLTKALGTGAVLAAAMRGRGGRAEWTEAALAAMQDSPFPAARALLAHGATACADVTGFGLLNHLAEMLEASGAAAAIDPLAAPALPGALEALEAGVASTLHPANAAAAAPRLRAGWAGVPPARLALLLDPQTAGGLLAGVPAGAAAACLAALRAAGCADAAVVGAVRAGPPGISAEPGAAGLR